MACQPVPIPIRGVHFRFPMTFPLQHAITIRPLRYAAYAFAPETSAHFIVRAPIRECSYITIEWHNYRVIYYVSLIETPRLWQRQYPSA